MLGNIKYPAPPNLAFVYFRFPCFFRFPISLAFLCVFPFFSKDFRGSAKRKTLAFFGVSLAFFFFKQGLEGQGIFGFRGVGLVFCADRNRNRDAIAASAVSLRGSFGQDALNSPEGGIPKARILKSLGHSES